MLKVKTLLVGPRIYTCNLIRIQSVLTELYSKLSVNLKKMQNMSKNIRFWGYVPEVNDVAHALGILKLSLKHL